MKQTAGMVTERNLMAKKKNEAKRVVLCGDYHCGHVAGLTPPDWHGVASSRKRYHRFTELQEQCWAWYAATMTRLQPIDVLVVNGDAIDGRGDKSGGLEQITMDRDEQSLMAKECIAVAKPGRVVMTYGTGYHTGNQEDYEAKIAADVGASIGSHEWMDVNGLVFDLKHHLGSSGIPHGRHTAIARDRMWNILWAERDEQPKSSVFVRSHVHYHQHCGGVGWLAMTLPALQAAATKCGSRRCSGTVDYGLVHFDVDAEGGYEWQSHIAELPAQKARTHRV